MLTELDEDLWVMEAKQRFLGVPVGTRMTVIRLPDRSLFLHSPIPIDNEVGAMGDVQHVVAPNRFHHLHVGPWLEHYPDATLWVAPGLEKKRPDLPNPHRLTNEAPEVWKDELDQHVMAGLPMFNEVVFFHRKTGTLLVTDVLFCFHEGNPFVTRLLGRALGCYENLAIPRDASSFFIKDRPAFRASVDHISKWPIRRVVLTHGRVCENTTADEVKTAFARVRA